MRFALLLLLLSGCSRDDPPVILGGRTMGTTWSLRLDGGDGTISQKEIQQQLDGWESIISHWQPDSAVSRFNAFVSTEWADVPAELVEVVELAQQIGSESDHVLDITIAPLIDLWGFGSKGRRDEPPTAVEIAQAKARKQLESLTKRESEVLIEVSNGLSNRRIGEKLANSVFGRKLEMH